MRLADPLALHRSACGLVRGTEPTMRAMLTGLDIPRTYLVGETGDAVADLAGLAASGVRVITVPGAGHCIMFDNPRAYAAAISAAA
ncbi:alpha/beta fold hydrolase [Streptomyces sp. IBSBF 2435]|uniref:alpha/beta fold hydrolase n=1 Tax=Streptomyces sp. IBSBF 2435 TaxID=2903531 RepID=UPI002FDBCE77